MTSPLRFSDTDIVERYTDQPARLPDAIRARAIQAFREQGASEAAARVDAYAFVDLDERRELADAWLVLGPTGLAVLSGERGPIVERVVERDRIAAVELAVGLSCHVLRVLARRPGAASDAANDEVLLDVRFSRRQQRSVEGISFVLEQALAGRIVPLGDPDRLYLEAVARSIRDAQALVATHQLAVVWRLLAYLGPYRRRVALGMTAAAVMTLLSLVPPWLTGRLVDGVIRPVQDGRVEAHDVASVAWLCVLGIAAVYAFGQLCVWLRLRLMATIGELVAGDLRREIYAHLQRLSMSFFSRKKTGSLITRVSSDTDRLWEFLAFGVVEVTLSAITLLALGSVLLVLDWRLGLMMALPVPFFAWAIHANGKSMNRLFLRAFRKWSRLTDVLSDTIPGIRVVKAFHQAARENARFGERNQDAVGEFNRIHAAWTGFWPRLMLAVQAMVVAVWALALPRLLGTSELTGPALSLGTFVSFLLYTTMFVQPIEIVGQVARIMHRATSSAHRVFEVLDTEPEVVDVRDPRRLEPVRGDVEFQNVSFAYDGVRQVLKGVSFQVQAGELIGLVGPSGGGKTTLINLLTRFYDVSAGRVSVDGADVRELDSGHYRKQVGMVLQDPYLFHGSILENIRYGVPEATLEQVILAARAANAHDFVCKLPHGYDTVVGERGHTLSGGERQRISIARAVLTDPRILILDEATSSVDTETERKIQTALDRLVEGRTVFAIAHRLSTLRRASRLFVIDDGRLVEQGTHAELLARPAGVYRRLFELQQTLHDAA